MIKYYDPSTGEEVQKEDLQEGIEYKEITTIETTPKYYTVTLKQTEYGEGDGEKYFKWDTSSGNLQLVETDEANAQITAKYDTSLETVTKTIDNGTVTNPSGTSPSKPYQFDNGAGLKNAEGSKISIDNKLFLNNKVTGALESTSGYKYAEINGGAVHNAGEITSITGAFVNNGIEGTAESTRGYAYLYTNGGAIYNTGTIGNITGDFIGNYASTTGNSRYSYASGGAIYNSAGRSSSAEIGNITGDFIRNYAYSLRSFASGGAIYNEYGTIGAITGDFIGNYASATGTSSSADAYGGAIYNYNGTIGNITGDFIGNYAKTDSNSALALGGAVYTNQSMSFSADGTQNIFSGNYTEDKIQGKVNNAIFVNTSSNTAPTITLKTQNNGTIAFYDQIDGGTVSGTTIDRTKAYNLALTGDGTGTISLYNDVKNANVTSDNVTIDFSNNETHDYNFVSMTANENSKLNIDIDVSDASAPKADNITTTNNSTGTLIVNTINTIGSSDEKYTVQIIKNENTSSTLQLALGDNIQDVAEDFVLEQDTVSNLDTFVQEGGIALATTDTQNDSITVVSEKIFDTLQLINQRESSQEKTFEFVDGTTYVAKEDLTPSAKGTLNIKGLGSNTPSVIDANNHTMFDLSNETKLNITNTTIENAKDYAIKAENENANVNLINTSIKNTTGTAIQSKIDLNIKADGAKSEFSGNTNAIYLDNANKTLTLETVNSGTIQFDDKIDGQTGYKVKITGDDEKSQVVFNNNVDNAVVNSENVTVTLNNNETFKNSDFTINSGTINLINNNTQQQYAKSFNITGPINLNLDADLAAKSMDRLPENTTVSESGKINVNNINLLSDATQDITQILFAHDSYKDKVDHIGPSELSTATQTTQLFAPIYKYNVSYNPEDGMFTFVRGAGAPSNSFEAFNPAVVAPTVATQAGAYTTQLQTFNYAFQHADTFMNIPYLERVSIINANKYALSPTADATDVGTFSPLLTKSKDPGFWIKPYASFESIPLDNGPKVSNINYGTLVGYDSPITSISNGWERVITGYVGYNGASQRYQGVDNYQNGGILGGTTTFYKGNFFNATTLSVGASVGDTTTMYGSENYTMLLAGIGNKTGYNFEFKEGKYIIQPAMLISYTFVNTFDYTNAAGLRIESDPLHALQLAPGVKFIMNTKNGWQPYIGVNMVWNLLDDSKVTANNVRLPEMSIKPYVQYGLGIQKRINDNFLAYGQAMIHNGGRNGISLSAGLRWKVGRKEK